MGTYTMPRFARPIARDMFTDLGVPDVEFGERTVDGRVVYEVTCPDPLPDGALRRMKLRLMTEDADQERLANQAFGEFVRLGEIRDRALDYAAIPAPTQAQAVAATQQLAQAVAVLADDLRLTVRCIAWYAADD